MTEQPPSERDVSATTAEPASAGDGPADVSVASPGSRSAGVGDAHEWASHAAAEADLEAELIGSPVPAPIDDRGPMSAVSEPVWDFGEVGIGGSLPVTLRAQPSPEEPITFALSSQPSPVELPFSSPPLPALRPAAPVAAGVTPGPPGRHRSPAVMAVLTVVTLGVYALVWHMRVNREMADFDPRMNVNAGRSAWAIAIPWLAGLLTAAAGVARFALDRGHVGLPIDIPVDPSVALLGLLAIPLIPYLILLVPFSAVAVVMTAERVRIVEDRVGLSPDLQIRPAAAACRLLVPIAGPFVLMAREQRRLNDAWSRIAPPGSRRG